MSGVLERPAGLGRRFVSSLLDRGIFGTAIVTGRFLFAPTYRTLRNQYLRYRNPVLHRWRPLHYSDKDPFATIEIDPLVISHIQRPPSHPRLHLDSSERVHMYENMGKVVDGEWDQQRSPWEALSFHQGFIEHFVHGVPWKETTFYAEITAKEPSFPSRWKHSRWLRPKSDAEFLSELAEFDELYHTIRSEGYRQTSNLDELTVNIARDGTFIHNNSGSHRLSIAKILEIDAIPARVLVRHRDWQAVRNAAKSNVTLPDELLAHPDLDDLKE